MPEIKQSCIKHWNMFEMRRVHTTHIHTNTHLYPHVTTAIEFTCDTSKKCWTKHPKQLQAERHNYVKSLSKPFKALRIQSNWTNRPTANPTTCTHSHTNTDTHTDTDTETHTQTQRHCTQLCRRVHVNTCIEKCGKAGEK